MRKSTIVTLIVGVTSAIAMSPALAQTYSYSSVMMTDHSMRTSKLVGLPVVNEQGQKIGTIVDVLVKDKATEPVVILSVGDFAGGGAKMVAAPLSHISVEKAQIMMAGATKAMVASMPAYQFNGLSGGGG